MDANPLFSSEFFFFNYDQTIKRNFILGLGYIYRFLDEAYHHITKKINRAQTCVIWASLDSDLWVSFSVPASVQERMRGFRRPRCYRSGISTEFSIARLPKPQLRYRNRFWKIERKFNIDNTTFQDLANIVWNVKGYDFNYWYVMREGFGCFLLSIKSALDWSSFSRQPVIKSMNDVHSGIRCDNTRMHLQVNFKKLSAWCATPIVESRMGILWKARLSMQISTIYPRFLKNDPVNPWKTFWCPL